MQFGVSPNFLNIIISSYAPAVDDFIAVLDIPKSPGLYQERLDHRPSSSRSPPCDSFAERAEYLPQRYDDLGRSLHFSPVGLLHRPRCRFWSPKLQPMADQSAQLPWVVHTRRWLKSRGGLMNELNDEQAGEFMTSRKTTKKARNSKQYRQTEKGKEMAWVGIL
jgi:hypothetical protein